MGGGAGVAHRLDTHHGGAEPFVVHEEVNSLTIARRLRRGGNAATNHTWFRFRINPRSSTSQVLDLFFGGGNHQGAGDFSFWIYVDIPTAGISARATPGGRLIARCGGSWLGCGTVIRVRSTWSPQALGYLAQSPLSQQDPIAAIKARNLDISLLFDCRLGDGALAAVQATSIIARLLCALYPEMNRASLEVAKKRAPSTRWKQRTERRLDRHSSPRNSSPRW